MKKLKLDQISKILDNISGAAMYNVKQTTLSSVIDINGKFKTIVFIKTNDDNYVIVGETSAYRRACFGDDDGLALLNGHGEWYNVTKEEGNNIYKSIIVSKKVSAKGNVYYKCNINFNLRSINLREI